MSGNNYNSGSISPVDNLVQSNDGGDEPIYPFTYYGDGFKLVGGKVYDTRENTNEISGEGSLYLDMCFTVEGQKIDKYSKINFVQTVITNSVSRVDQVKGEPFADFNPGNSVPYLYYDENNPGHSYNLQFNRFSDAPNRPIKGLPKNFYWQAELSIMGYRNGKWERITTIRYGFESSNGKHRTMIFGEANPSSYHLQIINKLNNLKR